MSLYNIYIYKELNSWLAGFFQDSTETQRLYTL